MTYLQAFMIAFSATMGFEVALALCLIIGKISKGVDKDGRN